MADRVFGTHEAEAMFEAIARSLEEGTDVARKFLRELQKEREMLTDDLRGARLALLRDGKNDPAKAVDIALHILEDD